MRELRLVGQAPVSFKEEIGVVWTEVVKDEWRESVVVVMHVVQRRKVGL